MDKEKLNEKIVQSLCREYQAVWIVNLDEYSAKVFVSNSEIVIPVNICKGSAFSSYKATLDWYTDNYVAEHDRERVKEIASSEVVCEKLSVSDSYSVEYKRIFNGKDNYNQMVFSRIDDTDKMERIMIGFRDIDGIKRAERDPLTNVYTRPAFFRKAQELIANNPDKQFDLMISDIVDFKEINEIYGSAIGDSILKWSGEFLSSAMTDDVIVGRFGGDQFVVICSHEHMKFITLDDNAEAFVNQMKESGLPKINVKYGIYENVKPTSSIMSVCDKAHVALNSIKHQYGKTSAYYDDNFRRDIEIHRRIESSMRQALEEKQFMVYYQPKHKASTGELVGAEALIRWIHPKHGIMRPDQFIEVFEKNGFIKEIDYYVWERTCQNIQRWNEMGLKTVPVSVNASKLTFEQENLVENLRSCAERYNVPPDKLHIEITETMTVYDQEDLIYKLNEIHNIGYKIELDDFGSGYSSISLLTLIPLDIVKLDRTFMKQFGNPEKTKVLSACIKLVKELNYKTVSEDVERQDQLNTHKNLGVDTIQGYYFSEPIPEDKFEEYMKKYL
ncbi:MAG: bifunctional diguanylate cyclase/phosphodiesterase [Ruminococcus sp.]|nr:bifunctional diguanylate cyclase/phosphodiesterase [Ruminococcus sp.]